MVIYNLLSFFLFVCLFCGELKVLQAQASIWHGEGHLLSIFPQNQPVTWCIQKEEAKAIFILKNG